MEPALGVPGFEVLCQRGGGNAPPAPFANNTNNRRVDSAEAGIEVHENEYPGAKAMMVVLYPSERTTTRRRSRPLRGGDIEEIG